MERLLERGLRYGGIPGCCGGASVCFALYALQVARASKAWEVYALVTQTNRGGSLHIMDNSNQSYNQDTQDDMDNKRRRLRQVNLSQQRAHILAQHAGSCAALAVTSAATTVEAGLDWRHYRKLSSLDQMEVWLLQRRPFFLRFSVLITAMISFGWVDTTLGGIRILHWPES